MPLTQMVILKAAAKEKPFKLSDGSGFHLLVQPNGSKLRRFRYRFSRQNPTSSERPQTGFHKHWGILQ